jgi:hypothetical protein
VTELTLKYNGGTANANIKVVQKKGGAVVFDAIVQPGGSFAFSGEDNKGTLTTEISIFVNGVLNTKIHTSCSQPIGPGLISGDFEVISGRSKNGGLLCPVELPPTGGGNDECSECDGKVTELTLKYNGGETDANIKVTQKKDGAVVFDATVQPAGTFTFSGEDKKGTLSTEISIFVNGVLITKIHTSCSRPIGPGLVSGDFEVISGRSKNGGLLCPIDAAGSAPPLRPDMMQMPELQIAPIVVPRETRALFNYPNPFNPETWIPYELAEDVNVRVEIYDVRGRLVRTLDVGHKSAGYYVEVSPGRFI